jgi:putative RNA 2'-phosphotransferase
MSDRRRLIKLSKFLALILRHQPERFGLQLDLQGWASLPRVLEILDDLPNLQWADRSDVLHVARQGTGDGKRRFEVEGDCIRALYGHSVDRTIQYQPVEPPRRLFHGTSPRALEAIGLEGLKPMDRQFVHLSPDRETAIRVGSRHTPRPVVVTVRAREADRAGISFYRPEEGVYLSGPIPPDFLDLPQKRDPDGP